MHRLDPRTKLLCSLVLMGALFAINRLDVMVCLFLGIALLYFFAEIPPRLFWGNLLIFFWLYLITFCLHCFMHPGLVLLKIPVVGWTITQEGVHAGLLFSLRVGVLIALSSLLMSVTMPQELTDGLEKLLSPFKKIGIPVSEGALMISIALRFVPILVEEAEKIRRAQQARGADLEGSLPIRLKKTLPMILPLFSSALKKADDLALALEAKGYRGGAGRTQLVLLKLSYQDLIALFVTISVTFTIFYFRV
jgi:energy-coupling factor transport system permease protein